MVKNDIPFAFNQEFIKKFEHAQHKLRTITYDYGSKYLEDYLMPNNGIFIEKHEFIQSITPINNNCNGFVILGREINNTLEFIAVHISFGYTLLIEPFCIHGDSTLKGMYMMAMTGNHTAMNTADTVLVKNYITGKNVVVKSDTKIGEGNNDVIMTSDKCSLQQIKKIDSNLKIKINNELDFISSLYWKPVVTTFQSLLDFNKTVGDELPN